MKKKVLITVKTYPVPSTKYDELVCTAGIDGQGNWIRIFPVPYRKLPFDQQYAKYQWLEVDLEKNTSDFRPESFRPRDLVNSFKVLETVDTKNKWEKRKEIVLCKTPDTNLKQLIRDAKDRTKLKSLSVFKPAEILDFKYEKVEDTSKTKMKTILSKLEQEPLFKEDKSLIPLNLVRSLPYKFSYIFKDEEGVQSKLMIEDWEVGQLYWNCMAKHGESVALTKVKEKYLDTFTTKNDITLFLGTRKTKHLITRNPFSIIGVFYPLK